MCAFAAAMRAVLRDVVAQDLSRERCTRTALVCSLQWPGRCPATGVFVLSALFPQAKSRLASGVSTQ